jgi:hypothetical protein
MVPALLPLVGATILASPQWCEAPFGDRARARNAAPSLAGVPGLLEVPAAVSAPDRSVTLAVNSIRTASIPGATQQRSAFVSVGFLPRLTLVGRGTVMDNALNQGVRDLAASVSFLAVEESGWRPAIAIAAQDVGGQAANFEARYAVASKTFFGRARASAGYGSGSNSLDGAFGGVEIAPCRWVTLNAENDGRRRNAGLRLAPLGDWGAARGIEPTLDLAWREGQGRLWSAGLLIQTSGPRSRPRDAAQRAVAAAPSAGAASAAGVVDALRDALVRDGFENVSVRRAGDTLSIAYENRVYNREEWDALGVVFARTVALGGDARTVRITMLRVGIPVLSVATGRETLAGFVAGTVTREAFATQLVVDDDAQRPAGPVANPSAFRLDITVRPRIENTMLTEFSVLESRISLLPEARLHLGRGLSVTARKAIVAYRSERFPEGIDEPNADQVAVHATRAGIPLASALPGVISQLSVGRFGAHEVGIAAGVDAPFAAGAASAGLTVAIFGEHAGEAKRSVALGTLRLHDLPFDLTTSLSAGRFRHGDMGGAIDVQRPFGPAEVAFFMQATDFAKMAGARVALPLTSRRDARPGPVRLRLPDYFDYGRRTQVLNPTNDIRADVARTLETGQDLAGALRMRDRLNGATLRLYLDAVRRAAAATGR